MPENKNGSQEGRPVSPEGASWDTNQMIWNARSTQKSSEHNDRTRTACVRTHRLTLPLGKGRIPSPPRSMQQRWLDVFLLASGRRMSDGS